MYGVVVEYYPNFNPEELMQEIVPIFNQCESHASMRVLDSKKTLDNTLNIAFMFMEPIKDGPKFAKEISNINGIKAAVTQQIDEIKLN